MSYSQRFYVNCTDKIDLLTITHDVKRAVADAKVKQGLCCILVPLSTGGVTLLENDKDIHQAFRDFIVALVPETGGPRPDRRSKTGATHAHLRALLVGPSLTVPIIDGGLGIGHWQEIILYDFDDRIARREFLVHIIGDGGSSGGEGSGGGMPLGMPGGGGGAPTLPPGRAKAV